MPNNTGLEFATKTDTGLVRQQNEDSVAISPEYGFAVLADGMGGYNAGEIASSIATAVTKEALEEGLRQRQNQQSTPDPQQNSQLLQLVVESIQRVNSAILDAAHAEPQYDGMGTTLVAALFHHDTITVAHVGDSRAYRLRHGELTQITRDHSLLQEQIDAGLISPEWAHYSRSRNLVTRAVGVSAEMEVEIHEHQTQEGDIFMLCSDGLSDMLQPEEIRDVLMGRRTSLEAACDILVQRANDNGGHDNISVILIKIQPASAEASGLLGRVLSWIR